MENGLDDKLYGEIIQKAWEDDAFKKHLMDDPIAAIEKLTGQKLSLPEGKTIIVKDQMDDSVVHINIPSKSEVDAKNKV